MGLDMGGMICFYCQATLTDASRSVDHLIPTSKGGRNTKENKVQCCKKCNHDKGKKSVLEFVLGKNPPFNHHLRERIFTSYIQKLEDQVGRIDVVDRGFKTRRVSKIPWEESTRRNEVKCGGNNASMDY